jgi:hypothetical protein
MSSGLIDRPAICFIIQYNKEPEPRDNLDQLYRSYFKTRKFSWVMTRKLSETLSRNFVHSCGMVSRKNARMASANCF